MLLPISWLKQFVDVKATPEQIAEKLTLSGSEVERIIRPDAGLSKVVVGEIKEIKPHPNADKLRLAYVDVGKGKLLEIVCGANNIEPGQKVPVVLLGGTVPGAKIEPREIRGIKSQGMLASGRELGVSDEQSGIFILPDEAKAGDDVIKLLQLDDPVLELEITPNRADCFSVIGLAREVAALFNIPFRIPAVNLMEAPERASRIVKISVLNQKLCPKYTVRVIENVKVGPSPLWLQNRLRQVGVKSINNIVDITNFVMMETGQPLHAFDFDRLEADKRGGQRGLTRIIARSGRAGEKILALDGNSYNLTQSMLVIADSESPPARPVPRSPSEGGGGVRACPVLDTGGGGRPIAIAGVMGGEGTSVKDNTKNVILEAAVFDAASVRRTARALGLRSESSARFEKGVDATATEEASRRAAQLISDIAGGTVLGGIVMLEGGRRRRPTDSIFLRFYRHPAPTATGGSRMTDENEVSRLLGITVKPDKIKSILESLGFIVVRSSSGFIVSVPSWRGDVRASADLVEEIGRMIDYNTLPKTLPAGVAQSPAPDKSFALRRSLRQYLAAAGYSEILTYSFYDEELSGLSGAAVKNHVIVTNPVNKEYKYLRASLAPAMFEKLSQNSSLLPRDEFQLFEIGKIFSVKGPERWQAAVGLIDIKATPEQLYRALRGVLEGFINGATEAARNGDGYVLSAAGRPAAHLIIKNKDEVPLRLRSAVSVMLLDLGALEKVWKVAPERFAPLPYYPSIERDLAIVVPADVQYKEIEEAVKKFDPLLKSAALFDVYHGLNRGTSLAFRLTFSSTDRTLEAREVDEIMERLKQTLKEKYKVSFR